jgi:alkylation response protein AidB-like acyl-CoA dehydrogenase
LDFAFSEEQQQLRVTTQSFLAAEAPIAYARDFSEQDVPRLDQALWKRIVALGWTGLTVSEENGGAGLGVLEAVVLAEEMGKVLLPSPWMSTVALAVPVLTAIGGERADKLLVAIAGGDALVSLALLEESGSWNPADVELTAANSEEGFVLEGTKYFVPEACFATHLLVVAAVDGGLGVFVVETGQAGLTIETMATVDATRRLSLVELKDVQLPASALLGNKTLSAAELDGPISSAVCVLAAEMCGVASTALDLTLDYLGVREQFGKRLGSFQALQHRCADMKVSLENARSLVYYAAWAVDEGRDDSALAVAMAKAWCSDGCSEVVAAAIQLHGGIGFTWEHDLQLLFRRVKGSEASWGDAIVQREKVASLLQL